MWLALAIFYAFSILLVELAFQKLKPIQRFYENTEPKTDIMRRWDLTKWSRLKFYLGSILLLPRLLLIIISVLAHSLASKIVMLGYKDSEDPIPNWRRFFFSLSSRFWARVLLLGAGFWKINTVGTPQDCSVIASNHCSWIDIIYFLTSPELPSFVSKAAVKSMPFVGLIAKTMQCIFIERTSDKSGALQAIEQRQKILHRGFPKLLVFPEGTTTNGTGLMPFKRGGFIGLLPVQPVCLKYEEGSFSPNMEIVPMWVHAVMLGCQFANQLTVHRLPVVKPLPNHSPEMFAELVRDKMSEYLKIPKVEYSLIKKTKLLEEIFQAKPKDF